jgi:CBS domain containing-hemolysin-like protein
MSTDKQSDPGEQPQSWFTGIKARLGLPNTRTLRETLENALKAHGEAAGEAEAFSPEEREMLVRILRFGALQVEDVMVPRSDIIAVDENEPISELLKTFDTSGVSRVPLYRGSLDEPRGMVHVKDVLHWLMGHARTRQAGDGPVPVSAIRGAAAGKSFTPDFSGVDLSKPIASAKLGRPMI